MISLFSNLPKLATGFRYLTFQSPDLASFQFIYPSVMAVIGTGLLSWFYWGELNIPLTFFSEINSLISVLLGFYIASLAAVASFGHSKLDNIMSGDTVPKFVKVIGKERVPQELTRRVFLCALFGYCAAISILTLIFSIGYPLLLVHGFGFLKTINGVEYLSLSKMWLFSITPLVLLLSSLTITTLLGLHYLIDRMHRA